MRKILYVCLILLLPVAIVAQSKSLAKFMSYPFPSNLTVSEKGNKIAWTINQEGKRNIYVAEAPDFTPKQITPYHTDDGQTLNSITLSANGETVVYIRGGDFGSSWDDALPVNPTFNPTPPTVEMWSIPFEGGEPKALGSGGSPQISPDGQKIAFTRKGQVYVRDVLGKNKATQLFSSRGSNGSIRWSPQGDKIAFISSRGDHAVLGLYDFTHSTLKWLAADFERDGTPRWSPDGSYIAFVRRNGTSGERFSILQPRHIPWKIMKVNVATEALTTLWEAPKTIKGSYPNTQGGVNLHWGEKNRIVFVSYQDGFPHLYSVSSDGGGLLKLTEGNFMAEMISLSPQGDQLLFAGNTGPDKLDVDRRHVVQVSIDKPNMKVMTPGDGIEWSPNITGDGKYLVYISATAKRPPLVTVMNRETGEKKMLLEDLLKGYPTDALVTPKQVVIKSADGLDIHCTEFSPPKGVANRAAIVFVHGGPSRQMLLGWHYSSYYSNSYSVNQYLATQGYTVLSVNYRLGIGYGYDFKNPIDGGTKGLSEYEDIKAAGEWLMTRPYVDPEKIGIYGGSYGGYLTAAALARNSGIFSVGVDIHGVHDRSERSEAYFTNNKYRQAPDAERAALLTWTSSPVADLSKWSSPVLIIHGDDDRNVDFSQSTDLVQRLKKYPKVKVETMVILDDTHHFLLFGNQLKVNNATFDFFERYLK